MATEVEILGHKAKIESVTGDLKDEFYRKEDRLAVYLSFDESVDGILGFFTYLPVKKYDREEFLYHVRRRGEEALGRILEKQVLEQRLRQEKDERQKAIDIVAAEAQRLIE